MNNCQQMKNLQEMDKLPRIYNLLKLNCEETDSLNKPKTNMEI